MTDKLFREEAIQHATRRLGGDVVVATPVATWILGALLVTVVAAGLLFVSVTEYARSERVSGWLVSDQGAVRATALRGGVIQNFLVEPGALVKQGEPIARLKLSVTLEDGDLGSVLEAALQSQLVASEDQFEATQARLDAKRTRLAERKQNVSREREALDQQLAALDDRLRAARETAQWAQKNFKDGLTVKADMEAWVADVRDQEQTQLNLKRLRAGLDSEISDIEQQIAAIPSEQAEAKANYDAMRSSLQERLDLVGADSTYLVSSPVTGRIEALSADVGETVQAGNSVAVLFPSDSELIAELFIPSRAIGFVKPGQEVVLKYDAFPFQRFGGGRAEVVEVSQTILSPGEVGVAGVESTQPVFRVRASLDEPFVQAYGEPIALKSGMMLSADIIFDRRTLFEWLLDPIYAVREG